MNKHTCELYIHLDVGDAVIYVIWNFDVTTFFLNVAL